MQEGTEYESRDQDSLGSMDPRGGCRPMRYGGERATLARGTGMYLSLTLMGLLVAGCVTQRAEVRIEPIEACGVGLSTGGPVGGVCINGEPHLFPCGPEAP